MHGLVTAFCRSSRAIVTARMPLGASLGSHVRCVARRVPAAGVGVMDSSGCGGAGGWAPLQVRRMGAATWFNNLKQMAASSKLSAMVAEKGVAELAGHMEDRADDKALQLEACKSLLGLTFEPTMQQQLIAGGGVEAIMKTAGRHSHDADIALVCAVVLQHLTTIPEHRSLLLQTGAVPVLFDLSEPHQDNNLLQVAFWRAITNVVLDPAASQHVADQAAGLMGIQCLSRFSADAHVVEAVSGALAALADIECAKLVDMEVVEALFTALQHMTSNQDERAGLAASNCLFALAKVLSSNKSAVGRVVENNGIKKIFVSMSSHPEMEYVQARACMALWAAFELPENVLEATASGALNAVTAAMRAFRESPDVQLWGCNAIGRALLSDPHAALRVGGVLECRAALEAAESGTFIEPYAESIKASATTILELTNTDP